MTETHEIFVGDGLAAKENDAVFEPCGSYPLEVAIAQIPAEVNTANFGAQCTSGRNDLEFHQTVSLCPFGELCRWRAAMASNAGGGGWTAGVNAVLMAPVFNAPVM